MEPIIAQRGPYVLKLEPGKRFFWCACGQSHSQPFCDSSHRGTGFTPVAFVAEDMEDTYLCGCKHSGNKPYCDGTHKKL